ncbi:MAG: tetratricopeptide repeat-containing sensor histidine kinase [Saprospiraceae bacterium]|nr:tetratricopeptide repeat-containing sensor histidine kinase [Saprospiraceae bacterium]
MKKIFIVILLFISISGFTYSQEKNAADDLIKRRDELLLYENSIGKDSIFYTKLDTFKNRLDNYILKFGANETYHEVSDYWGKKYAAIDPYATIEFFKNNIKLAEKDNNKKAIALNQHELAKLYFNLQQVEYAIDSYIKTSKMFKEMKDWHAYAYCIIDIANVYYYREQFNIAYSYYDEAFNIMKDFLPKEDFYYGAALCYMNKGSIEERQKNYKAALKNYKIAFNYKKKNKKENQYSYIYHHIAVAYENLNNTDSAIYYFNLAVETDNKYNLVNELFFSHKRFGDFYLRNKKINESKEHYIKAYSLAKKNNQQINLAAVTEALGNLFVQTEQYDSAILYYEKAFNIASKENIMLQWRNLGAKLMNLYSRFGQNEQQLKYLKSVYDYEKQANTDNLYKIEVQYEFNERIKEKELMELKSQKQQIFMIGISVMTLLLAFIAFMFFRQRVKLKRINTKLENKNKKIETQARNLELVNHELKKLDEFKEGLTGLLVHDLKNPINSILHLTELIEEKDENQALIRQCGNQTLNLIHNILDVHKYENLEMPLDLCLCKIKEITDKSIRQEKYLSNEKNIIIENTIPDSLVIEVDCEKLERVLTNLITNAIKFTPNNGSITIGYNDQENCFFVKDTGMGIDKEFQKKIFNKFSQVIAKKSGKALSTGLGLTFCKLAIEAHGGKIWLESEAGKGSTFFFTLPKK